MSLYIKKSRLKDAIIRLSDWKGQVQSQTVNHIFPFLGLLAKGVNSTDYIRYEEADDFEFFDNYFKLDARSDHPYFDPLNRKFRIASHPHSNVATLRKNTFENRWNAAESDVRSDGTYWKISPDAAKIISDRAMTRAGVTRRANVIDLSVWLFRHHEFPDNADSESLLKKFRSTFSMTDDDFNQLFEYTSEATDHLFTDAPLLHEDVNSIALELELEAASTQQALTSLPIDFKSTSEKSALEEDDPVLAEVRGLLTMGSSGIILRGAPGTSKSWYAWNVALSLTNNNPHNIFRIQFHPSYGYEDFVEGYLPNEQSKSGFSVDDRVFLKAVEAATKSDEVVVLIIDEINRGDTSRIFGELLTYIEHGWRNVPFRAKLSGKELSVPRNLVVLATMNPHDRSITQLDMALLRRFDHLDIAPSTERAAEFMINSGMQVGEANTIANWFDDLQKLLPFGIGHAYFLNVGDIGRLGLVWRYRILPFCENILEFEPERLDAIKRSFDALDRRLKGLQPE